MAAARPAPPAHGSIPCMSCHAGLPAAPPPARAAPAPWPAPPQSSSTSYIPLSIPGDTPALQHHLHQPHPQHHHDPLQPVLPPQQYQHARLHYHPHHSSDKFRPDHVDVQIGHQVLGIELVQVHGKDEDGLRQGQDNPQDVADEEGGLEGRVGLGQFGVAVQQQTVVHEDSDDEMSKQSQIDPHAGMQIGTRNLAQSQAYIDSPGVEHHMRQRQHRQHPATPKPFHPHPFPQHHQHTNLTNTIPQPLDHHLNTRHICTIFSISCTSRQNIFTISLQHSTHRQTIRLQRSSQPWGVEHSSRQEWKQLGDGCGRHSSTSNGHRTRQQCSSTEGTEGMMAYNTMTMWRWTGLQTQGLNIKQGMKKLVNPTTYFFQQAEQAPSQPSAEILAFARSLVNCHNCELCLQPYDMTERVPRILIHCGHTFCTPCLEQFYMKRRVRCPMCLKLVKQLDSLDRLPINHTVFGHLVDRHREECTRTGTKPKVDDANKYLFSEFERVQKEAHRMQNPLKYDEESGLPFCVFHSDRVQHFCCESHKTFGCRVCIEIGHSKPDCQVVDLYTVKDPEKYEKLMYHKNSDEPEISDQFVPHGGEGNLFLGEGLGEDLADELGEFGSGSEEEV